jgi:hypothetical protein
MPRPGKLPLNRFHRVKGPVYRHASLMIMENQHKTSYTGISEGWETYALAHGSFLGVPAAAANALGSKPVRFWRGALRTLEKWC